MSPGVNDGSRNTGTVPKSNRRNDRNRERNSAVNQFANRFAYHFSPHSNNLFPLDWKPVSEREAPRIAKNSNTRSISSAPSTSYQDISEFASHNCGRQYNYSSEELAYWQKMVTPAESRTQSPPRVQTNKRSNVDKMPDKGQIESRLNQIRDYIRASSNMMDQLSQSNDPLAQAQHEKLGKMVEDLHDSERKLSKLLELTQNCGIFDQNGEIVGEEVDENGDTREIQLRKKMEESQRKIAQLQEHQANLVGMQLRLRMQLTEARQAQEVLLQHENSKPTTPPIPLPSKVEQLESETLALKGKLAQLQTKKKHMDHFVAELQALEMSDRASCSSDGSRNFVRDKAAELEAMKAQVAHLKALMEQATRVRECGDDTSEPEADVDVNGEGAEDAEANDEENATNISFDRQSDSDDISNGKVANTDDRPTVEKIQAVTRELREQATLLQNARAELQRLKQPSLSSSVHSNSSSAYPNFNPPPSLAPSTNSENKQSKSSAAEVQPAQEKRRQFEDFMRKDSYQGSSVNCDVAAAEVNSHRSSSSHVSHTSNPANIWPPPAIIGSSEQNGDTASPSEHLLDMGGPHPPAIENGFHGSWWPYPVPPMNQLQHGSAEYYRQLILGSQAQQLQMMGMTLQQCCQLLASQQRELQSMRSAITQLQMQLRQQNQLAQRANNVENQEDYSNLSRNAHHLGEGLDGTLPPSSSLPNLVSLPNSSPAMSHSAVASTSTQHQQQQQQLNNQVPPGNRANNYWDNFRSYSRQNLLSGNTKPVMETATAASGKVISSTNAGGNSVNSAVMKDKLNRDQGGEHLLLPSLAAAEANYSPNFQWPSNLQPDRENNALRSNIFASEVSQHGQTVANANDNLWDEAHSSYRLPSTAHDEHPRKNFRSEMREVIFENQRLRPLLLETLRVLPDTQSPNNPLNETTEQTASESCQSSDEDSEIGEASGITLECQPIPELIPISQLSQNHVKLLESTASESASSIPMTAANKPGCNEDLAEADQSRPESSDTQQIITNDTAESEDQEEGATYMPSEQPTSEVDKELESLARAEDERAEDPGSDKANSRSYHH